MDDLYSGTGRSAMLYLPNFPLLQLAPVRHRFYQRWGHERAVIEDATCRSSFEPWAQPLSLKLVAQGCERYEVDGRRLKLDPDNVLVTGEGARVASRIHSPVPVHSTAVFFPFGGLAALLEALSEERGRALPASFTFTCGLRPRSSALTGSLERLLAATREQRSRVDVDFCWLAVANALVDQELQLHGQEGKPHRDKNRGRSRTLGLLRAREVLEQDFARDLSLDDLAGVAHMSRFHFCRAFASRYGAAPGEYLIRKRLRAAVRTVLAGGCTMDAVAASVGYGSRVTLYRHLRRRTGLTLADITRDASLAQRALGMLAQDR